MADNNSINWTNESVFYQIYPIGFCGAPRENDGVLERRILKVVDWIPHLMRLGCNAVYFSPVFESDKHGYDTRDYQKIDVRLGTNEDFANVCAALHEAGIRVVLDGVFNHVGRGFWAFQDVLEKREQSRYKDWFFINFGGNDAYGDNLWYEGWEGHYDLVKLNLHNPEVVQHLFESIRLWTEQFDIDGLRLDVAYLLDEGFLRQLRSFCDSLKPDFLLLGEILGGDFKRGCIPALTTLTCLKLTTPLTGSLVRVAYIKTHIFCRLPTIMTLRASQQYSKINVTCRHSMEFSLACRAFPVCIMAASGVL